MHPAQRSFWSPCGTTSLQVLINQFTRRPPRITQHDHVRRRTRPANEADIYACERGRHQGPRTWPTPRPRELWPQLRISGRGAAGQPREVGRLRACGPFRPSLPGVSTGGKAPVLRSRRRAREGRALPAPTARHLRSGGEKAQSKGHGVPTARRRSSGRQRTARRSTRLQMESDCTDVKQGGARRGEGDVCASSRQGGMQPRISASTWRLCRLERKAARSKEAPSSRGRTGLRRDNTG